MLIHDVEQRSDEWFELKRGIPSASCAGKIITPVRGDLSSQADKYISHLICEKLGLPGTRTFSSRSMENGIEREPMARNYFSFTRDVEVREIGFITDDRMLVGLSPDGIYTTDGNYRDNSRGLEIKCPDPYTHVTWLRAGKLPDEHKAQVHWSMAVTDMPWTFLSWYPGLEPLVIDLKPDSYTEKVQQAIITFTGRLAYEGLRFGIEAPNL